MAAVYKYSAYLRVIADSEDAANRLAEDIAAAVSRGEATLALDDSPPSVEEREE